MRLSMRLFIMRLSTSIILLNTRQYIMRKRVITELLLLVTIVDLNVDLKQKLVITLKRISKMDVFSMEYSRNGSSTNQHGTNRFLLRKLGMNSSRRLGTNRFL